MFTNENEALNNMIKNAVENCESESINDFADDTDDTSETHEIPEEEVPEEFREPNLHTEASYNQALNSAGYDRNIEKRFLRKIYNDIKKIVISLETIYKRFPLITASIYIISNLYYTWLMIFAAIKCFGSERAKSKASGKKLITTTMVISIIITTLSYIPVITKSANSDTK